MPRLLLNIDVPDIAAGEAFYTTALGLHVGRRFGPDFVELLGAPSPIYLLKKESGTSIGPEGGDTRRYDRQRPAVHPDFGLETGRASWRARECQYGEIPVFAV